MLWGTVLRALKTSIGIPNDNVFDDLKTLLGIFSLFLPVLPSFVYVFYYQLQRVMILLKKKCI